MTGVELGVAVKTRDCPECRRETSPFNDAAEFERWIALAGDEVEWREHQKEIVAGCTHCAIGWKTEE